MAENTLHEWRNAHCIWINIFNIIKVLSILPTLINGLNTIPMKISGGSFVALDI